MLELFPGDVVWMEFGGGDGREQSGRRPAVVIASPEYLDLVDSLALVVPVSTRDRGWPNHVLLTGPTGLDRDSWALTEQPRTRTRDRIFGIAGRVDAACLAGIRRWLRLFLDL